MNSKAQIYDYLIRPSPLFLKQVIKVEETKAYIIVQDLRKVKNLFIPDNVVSEFEKYLKILKTKASKANEYDGIRFLIIPKTSG